MKKICFALLMGADLLVAVPSAQAQTDTAVPTVTTPALLDGVQAYAYLVGVVGADPFVAADTVLHSQTAYGLYFTLDQLLAQLPRTEE